MRELPPREGASEMLRTGNVDVLSLEVEPFLLLRAAVLEVVMVRAEEPTRRLDQGLEERARDA
jgi:hypothetical protein